jgi:PAS domain S-box-containing protein
LEKRLEERQGGSFPAMFDPAPVAIWIQHQDRIVYINPAALAVLGARESSQILGRPIFDFISPEDHEQVRARILAMHLSPDMAPILDERFVRLDGSTIDVEVSAWAVPFGDSTAIRVSFVDVTGRKRVESALRESEQRSREQLAELQDLYDHAPVGLCVLNRDLRYVRINERFAEIDGVPVGEHLGRKIGEVLPVFGRQIEPGLRRVIDTGEPVLNLEVTATLPGAREACLVTSWLPHRDGEGRIDGINMVAQDVTERNVREQALRISEGRFRAALKTAPVVVFNQDLDLRYTWIHNPALGFSEDQVVGAFDADLNPDNTNRAELEALKRRVLETGVGSRQEIAFSNKGEERYFDLTIDPLLDNSGALIGITCAALDITDRRSSEMVVRQSEQHLRRVLDSLFVFVGVMTPDGILVQANRAPLEAAGIRAEDVLGKPVEDTYWFCYSPLVQERMREAIRKAQAGESSRFDLPVRMRDGRLMPIDFMLTPMRDDSGRITHLIPSAVDITERKRAEEERESDIRALADSIPQLVWMAGPDGWIFWYNQRWYEYTGTTQEEMEGWGWRRVHDPAMLPAVLERWRDAIAKGEPFEMQFPLRGSDGTFRWFLTRVEPVRDESGNVARWYGTNTDVDELRRIREELYDSQSRLRAIVENARAAVSARDLEGRFILANRETEAMLGAARGELIGKRVEDLLPAAVAAPILANDRRVLEVGPLQVEEIVPLGDIQRAYVSVKFPLRNAAGEAYAVCGISTDITGRKTMEEALRRSNEDLQQFAYVASHDLQEPLRTVVSFTQMLSRRYGQVLDPQGQEYMIYVVEAAQRMSTLISDLLSYTRVASDESRADTRVDLNSAVQAALKNLNVGIAECGARVECSVLPAVKGDAAQMTLIFQNLLSNSLKYRQAGVAPLISIRVAPEDAHMWRFSVADNGKGFRPEYAERIFGIFKRLQGRDVPGSGIGLAIAKTIVERHGGRIWAEGQEGAGATFHFTLPALGRS